jgi:soluble P-type ATPase
MIEIEIPGYATFAFHHLVLDVNGTLAKDGRLLTGVRERLGELRKKLEVHLVTADTHGTQDLLNEVLQLNAFRIPLQNQAKAKLEYIEQLGKNTVATIGNGANDALMLEHAALGILVIGPEGAAIESLLKAKIVAPGILEALDLLLYPKRLIATLRR